MSATEIKVGCLNEQQCQRFLSGELDESTSAAMVEHIEHCDRCQQALESLTLSDLEHSLTDAQRNALSQAMQRSSDGESIPGFSEVTTGSFGGLATGVFRTPSEMSQKVPEIPGYEALEEIANGGMGTVYRARQTHLDRDVAIKVMRRFSDTGSTQRFFRELQAIGKLEHDHIVRAYDAGEANGIPYLVMEFLQGTDLRAFVQSNSRAISVQEASHYVRQAALGLQVAHDAGFVHRDVKPSNLMLTTDGTVKLLDLGLVHVDDVTAVDGSITDEASIMGSLDYIAPEQGRDATAADARSDVYSLGCTLFALLTGNAPFSGKQFRSASQKLLAHACEPRPDARNLNANVPPQLSQLVRRMMSIDPADRPQSAKQVAEELTAFASESMGPPKSRFTAAMFAGFGIPLLLLSIIIIKLSDGSTITVETDKPVVGIAIKDSSESAAGRQPADKNTGPKRSLSATTWSEDAPEPAKLPFDPATAVKHQKQWAQHVGMPVAQKNSLGMTMRLIPPGEFQMGMTPEQLDAILNRNPKNGWFGQMAKRHLVRLTNPMLVSQRNVTVEGYNQLMVYAPASGDRAPGNDGQSSSRTQLPVCVGWIDAVRFCNQLSLSEGLPEYYSISDDGKVDLNQGDGYRLLTEAEWEFACRSGSDEMFWNDGVHLELEHYAAFAKSADDEDFRQPPVGTKAANGFGLQDFFCHRDWCYDAWDIAWYERSPVNDPVGPETGQFETHVIRGPGRNTPEFLIGSAIRSHGGSEKESERCSIRICRTISPQNVVPPDNRGKVTIVEEPPSVSTTQINEQPLGTEWPEDAPEFAVLPFDSSTAKAHQQSWAKYIGVELETKNTVGIDFTVIPPGEFLMGSTREAKDKLLGLLAKDRGAPPAGLQLKILNGQAIRHEVRLTNALAISTHPVTVRQYQQVSGEDLSASHIARYPATPDDVDVSACPASVNFNQALRFCNMLSDLENLPRYYHITNQRIRRMGGTGYRLPTEAEWEFACRSGSDDRFWTDRVHVAIEDYAWFAGNDGKRSFYLHPVGEKLANGFGLHDMLGGSGEWCFDFFDPDWYQHSPATDPAGPALGGSRVRRSGGTHIPSFMIGSAARSHGNVRRSLGSIRLVRTLEQ